MATIGKKKNKSGKVVWFVDYTIDGKRDKIYGLKTREEALVMKAQIELRELDLKIGYRAVVPITIEDAIQKYHLIVKKSPATKANEIPYFIKFLSYFGRPYEFLLPRGESDQAKLKREHLKRNAMEHACRKDFNGPVSTITLLDLEQFRLALCLSTYSRSRKPSKNAKDVSIEKNRKPLKASTVNRHFNTYCDFFTECRKWNFLTFDPTADLIKLPEENPRKKAFSPEQIGKVMQSFEVWTVRILIFITLSGARRSEACNVEPKDVYLDEGFVILKSWKGGTYHEREIPLPAKLWAFMKEQMEICTKNKWVKVFCDENGEPINPSRLSTQMIRAANAAGIRGLNLHALRHSFATWLSDNNVNTRKIQKLLGHRSLATTEKYSHNGRDALRRDVQEYENAIVKTLDISSEITAPKGHEDEEEPSDD